MPILQDLHKAPPCTMVVCMEPLILPVDVTDEQTRLQIRMWTVPVLVLLSVLAVGITVLSLNFGFTIIFQNLYYLPIILVCINYPKRGMLFTTGISLVYVTLMLVIPRDSSLVLAVLVRFVFFELVAAVIVYLCTRRAESEAKMLREREALEKELAAQKEWINSELEKNRRLVNAFQETNRHEQLLFSQLQVPLVVLNQDLYIIRVNRAFEKLTGRQLEDLTGRKLSTIPLLDEAAGKPYGNAVELALRDADGISHPALWSFSAVYSPGETVPSAIVGVGQLLTGC